MKREEQELLLLLKKALAADLDMESGKKLTKEELDGILTLANKHSVLALLYDVLMQMPLQKEQKKLVQNTAERVAQQNYHLLFLAKYVTGILKQEQIDAVLLKGGITASYYPVPELRKSGDVDLFVSDQVHAAELRTILLKHGIREQDEQHANHHISFESQDGIIIEIHTDLIEQTGKKQLDSYVKKCQKEFLSHRVQKDVMGIPLYSVEDAYFAYFLLLHMAEDFLRAGFGLKLLCDWVVVWNHGMEDNGKQTFLRLVTESGIFGFARMISAVCIRYLGLREEEMTFLMEKNPVDPAQTDEFLSDILEAEEFGRSAKERMVVLQQSGISGLIREFHHQVQLTYPNASKHIICIPVLWVMLLIGFLHRNRTLRKVSTWKVIKNATERGSRIQRMNLFE